MASTTPNFLRGNTPAPGQPIQAKSFGDLSAAATAARQIPQPNVQSVFTAGGIVVFPTIGKSSSSPPPVLTPFEIFVVPNLSGMPPMPDGTYNVTLNIGVLNGFLASNIFNTINLAIASLKYVILSCVADAGAVTSYAWDVIDPGSFPSPVEATGDAPPGSFTVLIGVILFTSAPVINQIVTTNLVATPAIWTVGQRSAPLPYGLAYENFYCWVVTSA
jgi:hypothetical protein